MIANKLTLKNFWSHRDTVIDFSKEFYMILGRITNDSKSNGSGKSTIARGISYALYGDASDEIKNDEAIYNDEDKMVVEFEFELNNIKYKIVRSVKRGSTPVVKITTNGAEVKLRLKEAQETINDILGGDFEIFRNTSYFKQGDLSSFSNLTPREMKEVVIKLLQLDSYNTYEAKAKDKIKEINSDIKDTEEKLIKLEAMINQEEARSSQAKYTDKNLQDANNILNGLKIKLENQKKQKEDKEAKQLKATNDSLNIYVKINNTRFPIKGLRDRIEKLNRLKTKCPTCESELNPQDIEAIVNSIYKEISDIEASLIPLEEEHKRLEKILSDIKDIVVDEENYSSLIAETSRAIGAIESELNQAKKDTDKIKKLKDNLIKGHAKLDEQEQKLFKYEKLSVAFGKKGIQAYIIENIIPEIQATTNRILEEVDTSIRITIESQKELKKGGKSETLDIRVLTEFGERPYMNYSGGEKTFIDFALRISLAIILTRRSECKIQTLILDEVWGQLDATNREIASKALRFIAKEYNFKKILIISHQEELQDAFQNTIMVEFDGNESKIIRND